MGRKKYSREQLIAILQEEAQKRGRPPTKREVKQREAIAKEFGSWNNGLIAAGLKINKVAKFKDEELLQLIRDKEKELGRTPTYNDVADFKVFAKRFGSWNKAVELAGFTINQEQNYRTDEELLQLIRDKEKELGRTPTRRDLPSVATTIRRRFGSWNKAVRLAGLKTIREYRTKEELIKILHDWVEKNQKIPTSIDWVTDQSLPSKEPIINLFGSHTKFLLEAGYDPAFKSPQRAESNEELLKKYIELSNKLGRPATGKDIDACEDLPNCHVVRDRFGSLHELKKLAKLPAGRDLRKFTKKELLTRLLQVYRDHGRLTVSALSQFIPISTLRRYFKYKKIDDLWELVEKESKKRN